MSRKKSAKKKIESEQNVKQEKKNISQNERQLRWILIGMVCVLLIGILVYVVVQEMKKFEYGGLDFEKIMYDQLLLYHSKIPVSDSSGNLLVNYNLYLRNDPRQLGDIPVNGSIKLMKYTYVSLDPEAEVGCSDSGIAGANFFSFLKIAGVDAKLAYNNKTYALARNVSYGSCQDNRALYYGYLVIKKGEENKIVQIDNNCYELYFKDCDILKVTERFMVAAVAHSKGIAV